jgi:exosome complex RNA-binding protein Rrp42 (RNase PH superfamily)
MTNNILTDVEKQLKKATLVDEVKPATKQGSKKFWLFVPLAVLAAGGCAFLVVRRTWQG